MTLFLMASWRGMTTIAAIWIGGGAASAPVVASAFHPSLATVGVLLAVLGYAPGHVWRLYMRASDAGSSSVKCNGALE